MSAYSNDFVVYENHMSNTLRQARILSSENDASVKQEQNTNVNIKITPPGARTRDEPLQKQQLMNQPIQPPINYPSVSPVNFTQPMDGAPIPQQMDASTFPSVQTTSNHGVINRGISDFANNESVMQSLETKNKFLEMIVSMYETNPLKINSYVVCESKLLMNMIKLLTDAAKVELVIDESAIGCGCSVISDKFIRIDKILVHKNNKVEDLKYGYNDIYTQFIRYGISMKLVV